MKKKLMFVYIGIAVICLVCLGLAAVLISSSLDELGISDLLPSETPSVNQEKVYLYKLPKDATEIQKEYYDELVDLTQGYPDGEFDPYAISKSVVKCFISDFYTWSNKEGNFDVGGLDFLYGPHHLTFGLYARDTYYQNFNHFEAEYGIENLPQVASVEITGEAYGGTETINDVKMDTYYLEAAWTYAEGSSMDTSKLQYKASFKVMENKESGRFEIIQILNIE